MFVSPLISQDQFAFPPDIDDVSRQAMDLIGKLICNADERLGINGLEDFKNHPFFTDIDWDNIREGKPVETFSLKGQGVGVVVERRGVEGSRAEQNGGEGKELHVLGDRSFR